MLTRPALLKGMLLTLLQQPEDILPPCDSKTCIYHKPPPNVDYNDNDTVFGRILRGETPANTLMESTDLLAFQDLRPRAPLHALIIPKRFIASVFDLSSDDLPLLQEMQHMAYELVEEQFSQDFELDNYILCFHIPPFNSVNHLHLHVLAPASAMTWYNRNVKYRTESRWSTSLHAVQQRLSQGKPAVPYQRPSLW